jgi:hypothetical protein
VQHAPLADKRVARDPISLEPYVLAQANRRMLFVCGCGRSLDEALDGQCVRGTVGSIETDGPECVARELFTKYPGERARAREHLA